MFEVQTRLLGLWVDLMNREGSDLGAEIDFPMEQTAADCIRGLRYPGQQEGRLISNPTDTAIEAHHVRTTTTGQRFEAIHGDDECLQVRMSPTETD